VGRTGFIQNNSNPLAFPKGTPRAIHLSPRPTPRPRAQRPRRYAWIVFALTFGLLISDYMSRQVLNAVFPLLKAEWALSDSQLGLLSGIVALMVGLLTFRCRCWPTASAGCAAWC
jgi:sugar phosphate permease